MRITATLPYPPTVNHYWLLGQGRLYISPAGRQYRRQVKAILKDAPQLSGRMRVMLTAKMPDRRKRDLDNVLKCLLDSLTHAGVWEDDSQVDELAIIRGEVTTSGCVELIAETINNIQGETI